MTTNTDGILDRCHCGARPKFVFKIISGYCAQCTECGESTDWGVNETQIMIKWNKQMRKIKEALSKEVLSNDSV